MGAPRDARRRWERLLILEKRPIRLGGHQCTLTPWYSISMLSMFGPSSTRQPGSSDVHGSAGEVPPRRPDWHPVPEATTAALKECPELGTKPTWLAGSAISGLGRVERKSDFGAVRSASDPGCVKNASEPRMLRIVFSIAYCQQHLPVRLISATTRSRWKFYAQVQRLSFHTGWTQSGRLISFDARENSRTCRAFALTGKDAIPSTQALKSGPTT